MAQQRPITCRGSTRSYPDGNESDESRAPRGDMKARKRNSVACARCRKRKIKCTGDLLDGNGCEACQAAGVHGSSCHYLRVNSHHIEELPLPVSSDSEWPYLVPAPGNYMTRSTTDPSQYALGNGSHASPNVPTPYASPGMAYSTAQGRSPYSTNYPTAYNNQYDVQRPIQGTSLHMSHGPAPNYSALEYSQQWSRLPSNGRPSSHNMQYEQDPSRYESSRVSYLPSSSTSVPNVAAEGSSIFPGLSPLATHLPAHGGNRTLPEHVSIHSFDSSNASIHGTDGDAGLYQQRLETGTSQESVSSASQDASSATGQISSAPSSSPSETQEMPPFAYIPMTQTSPTASSENDTSFRAMESSTTSNIGSYTASQTSASNGQPPSLTPTFDGYGGHRGSHASNRALEPGMAIRNGNIYDPHGRPRILQPQPRRSPSYDLLKGSFEGSAKPSAKVLKPNGHGRKPDGKR